jgi:hypothetical protein
MGSQAATEHIAVESKAVRWGEDGVSLSFVMACHGSLTVNSQYGKPYLYQLSRNIRLGYTSRSKRT